jgi:hypothetical protein
MKNSPSLKKDLKEALDPDNQDRDIDDDDFETRIVLE